MWLHIFMCKVYTPPVMQLSNIAEHILEAMLVPVYNQGRRLGGAGEGAIAPPPAF